MCNKKNKVATEAITRSTAEMTKITGNIYETVVMISKRANQIALERQKERSATLEQNTAIVEESNRNEDKENSPRVLISRCYEKQPKPTLVATYEYEENMLSVRKEKKNESN